MSVFYHLVTIAVLAMAFDRLLGDPRWLWQRLPHPVVVFGFAIDWVEKLANQPHRGALQRRFNGFIAIILLVAVAAIAGFICTVIFRLFGQVGIVLEGLIASLFLAQRSLVEHVRAVQAAFETHGLSQARADVSRIVGRDPENLDEEGICRAAIESLAENSSDGVIAPLFWLLLFGLPGIFAYKMLNTADSMIGHKSERFRAFGFAAAKADDIANYVPARLCALLTIVACYFKYGRQSALRAWHVMRCDAKKHRSPNAGWIESTYAGALDISLAGPRYYGDICADDAFLNAHGRPPQRDDIGTSLALFRASMNLPFAFVVLCYGLLSLF